MTGRVGTERILDAFLAPDDDELADSVIQAVLDEIARTPQRWALRAPWRTSRPNLPRAAAIGLAATAVLVAGTLLLGAWGGPPSPAASSPTPSVPATGGTFQTPPATAAGLLAPLGYTGAGTIEFTKHDASGANVLWLIDPSGENATKLVQGGCCGLFSPDGEQLAIAAPGVAPKSLTKDPSLLGIEVLDRPGARVAFVVPTACGACEVVGLNYEPDAWSPDGRYIALSMWSDTDSTKAGMGIADRDFSLPWDWAQTRATGNQPDLPIAFSPDSSQLLFMRTEQQDGPTSTGTLFALQLRELSVRPLTAGVATVSTNGLIQAPASWSPDGRQIVYAARTVKDGATGIFLASSAPGGHISPLVPDAPGATSARFSPDGSLIAFDEASTNGFHDLWVIHPDGNGLTNLTEQFGPGVCCGQWSPDGRAILVAGTTSDDNHNNLFIVAADGSGIWQVTNNPNAYTGFLWGQGFR